MPDVTLAMPSVMSLLLQMSVNGHPLSTGTGFVVESRPGPVLITNWHNLSGLNPQTGQTLSSTGGIPDEITIMHNVRDQLGQWRPVREPLLVAGQPRWKEHPTLGWRADLAALPLTQLEQVHLYPYNFAGPDMAVGPAGVVSVLRAPRKILLAKLLRI